MRNSVGTIFPGEEQYSLESATDSWEFGSLSQEKTAKMEVGTIFPGEEQYSLESAADSWKIGSLSPDRTDKECRQNSRRSDCPISFPGKVPRIRGKLVHFPRKNRPEMDYECM